MKHIIKSPRNEQNYGVVTNMHSHEMMEALGLKPGAHLPKEGMPERLIQGIRVYVKPSGEKTSARSNSSKHRVIAICPGCNRHISAGRLHQHDCKEKS
jgi:hypothetical protein